MSEIKTRHCDCPDCEVTQQIEPLLYGGGLLPSTWIEVHNYEVGVLHFCRERCLLDWLIKRKETTEESEK